MTYTYDNIKKNQLNIVYDATNNPNGFMDDAQGTPDTTVDYGYDIYGNMTSDTNKGITQILYNHLNLPIKVTLTGGIIEYLYNAVGVKVQKKVTLGTTPIITDYQSGYQYKNAQLQFFPHAEGYVNVLEGSIFNYVYNYTDHLGNIRVSYGLEPGTNVLKILEENHYYPFGLKHQNYNVDKRTYQRILDGTINLPLVGDMSYKYKYNGKEWQDELGLNVYDYGARLYMPDLGRWGVFDPAAEYSQDWSPYSYCYNDPMTYVDEDGEMPGPVGFVLGALSNYIGQVGYNYFYNNYDLTTSMSTDIKYWSIVISGISGAATGGISSIKSTVSSGVGKKIFVQMIDYGIDALVKTMENVMSEQLNDGDYDFWKCLTGGLIEAGIGNVIPLKYVDKLQNKLFKKMKISANKMAKYKKRMQQDSNRNKQTKKRNRQKYDAATKDFESYRNAYQGVKTVNDAFKSGGVSALTDELFKKDPEKKQKKGSVEVGDVEDSKLTD